jgi:hypothetical protein
MNEIPDSSPSDGAVHGVEVASKRKTLQKSLVPIGGAIFRALF